MNIATQIPYSWIRSIPENLISTDQIPLWGSPPPFPWEEFGENLAHHLKIAEFSLKPIHTEWLESKNIQESFGSHPFLLFFQIAGLKGEGILLISEIDLKKFMLQTFQGDEKFLNLENENFIKEMGLFLALEFLNGLTQIQYDSTLSISFIEKEVIPETPFLALDVEISIPSNTLTARIGFSSELQRSLATKYTPTSIEYPESLAESLRVTVQCIGGRTTIKSSEWKSIQTGDLLLLDSTTLSIDEDKGRIVLYVNNAPIFRGKIKDGNIKILEYPVLQEVNTPMAKQQDYEDEDFETDADTQDETFEEENTDDTHEDFDLEDDDHSDLTEEEGEEGEEEEEEEKPVSKKQTSQEMLKEIRTPASTLIKAEDIPLTISIEVARIQMSVKQLIMLAPGNILDLNVHPENGVDLVVNGACIGKGELLKVGDILGVRILDKA